MTHRKASIMILVVSVAALLFLSCQKKEAVIPLRSPLPTWPPDTMAITLLGSGHLGIVASWKAHPSGGSVAHSVTYEVADTHAPLEATNVKLRVQTPTDTAAASILRIFNMPQNEPSAPRLYLIKWPPDTTGGR